jgi:hypothetical protein
MHPFAARQYDCLTGGPPGLYVDGPLGDQELYIFVGLGQNPGAMGCYRMPVNAAAGLARSCNHIPLFSGAPDYGLPDASAPAANPHFGFRTNAGRARATLGIRSSRWEWHARMAIASTARGRTL